MKQNTWLNKITALVTIITMCLTFFEIVGFAKPEEPTESDKLLVSSYVVNDDFEDIELNTYATNGGTLANWSNPKIGSNCKIGISGDESNKYLELYNALKADNSPTSVSIERNINKNLTGNVIINAKLYLSAATVYAQFHIRDMSGKVIAKLYFDKKGQVSFNGGNKLTFNAVKWMNVSFDIDTELKTVECYLDGIKFADSAVSYFDATADAVNNLYMEESAGANNYFRIDDLMIISTEKRSYKADKEWSKSIDSYTFSSAESKEISILDPENSNIKSAISGIVQVDYDLNILVGDGQSTVSFYDTRDKEIAEVYIGDIDGSSEEDRVFNLNGNKVADVSVGLKHNIVTLNFKDKTVNIKIGKSTLDAPVAFKDISAENLAYIKVTTMSADNGTKYEYSNFNIVSLITVSDYSTSSNLEESEKNYYAYLIKDDFESATIDEKMKSGDTLVGWTNDGIGSNCYIKIAGDTNNKYLEFYNALNNDGSAAKTSSVRNMPGKLKGKVNINTDLYIHSATAYFEFTIRDSAKNAIAKLFFGKNGKVTLNGNDAIPFSVGRWININFVIDTDAKTVDCSLGGVKFTDSPTAFFESTATEISSILVSESSGNKAYLRMDNVHVYYDFTDELNDAFASINETTLSEEKLNKITWNLNSLNDINLDGFDVSFESSNEKAVKKDGKVARHNFTQSAVLTCKIVKKLDYNCVQDAYVNKEFYLTVLPKENVTDEEIVRDILDYYLTFDVLTDEEPDAITHDLKDLPKKAPDGVSIQWTSTNPASISEKGGVMRPAWGEEDAETILVAYASLGDVTLTKDFEFVVLNELNPDEVFDIVLPMIEVKNLSEEQPNAIKKDLILPKTIDEYNVTIYWTSSDKNVISNSGKVVRGEEDKSVILTATFVFDGYTAEKKYEFIVKTSPNYMVSRDMAYLELDVDEATKDFSLPTSGSIYDSTDISWESNSGYIVVNGDTANVTRPTYEEGDKTVTMTATLKNETYTATKNLYVIVKCLPSDESVVNDIVKKLTFNYISAEDINAVKNNLSLQQDFGNGVICEWSSSNISVINPLTGEVVNPGVGENPVKVTLTAIVKKNSALSAPVKFDITVLPFESANEILQKAKNSLTFSEISTDSIELVKDNLSLPLNWKYNTTLTWMSSDNSALEIIENNSMYSTGKIKKNEFGKGLKSVELCAEIIYGSDTVTKDFLITIAEENGWYSYYYEDFDAYEVKAAPYNDIAKWSMCLTSQGNHWVVIDPTNSDNKVLMVNKPANVNRPDTFPATSMFINNVKMTGKCKMAFKMLMDENTTKEFIFEPYSSTSSLQATFDGETGVVKLGSFVANTHFQKGKWIDVELRLNTETKECYLYLDGVCEHEDNPYKFTVGDSFGGCRFRSSQATSETDTLTYMDDLEFSAYMIEYDKTLLDYIRDFEAELMLKNDFSNLSYDIRFPTSQIATSYKSADKNILSDDGIVGKSGQTVLYITYKNAVGTITKPYVVNVSYNGGSKMTDKEMASADIDHILKTNNFNALTEDIKLSDIPYSSAIIISSSNTNAISNNGKVNRNAQNITVTLTITAKKGEEIIDKTVTAIVKGTNQTYEAANTSGGGGGGGSLTVNYGYTENKKSGVTVADPIKIQQSFDDLDESHWAYKDIMMLTEHGIIDSDGKNFAPTRNATRGEVAKAIVIALGYEVKDYGNKFDDVSSESKYYEYISTARHYGIVFGEGDNNFGIDSDITREDICVIINRAAENLIDSIKAENDIAFTDAKDISGYAYRSVLNLMKKGIVCGNELGEFNPKDNCTRAEFCSIVSRLLGGVK